MDPAHPPVQPGRHSAPQAVAVPPDVPLPFPVAPDGAPPPEGRGRRNRPTPPGPSGPTGFARRLRGPRLVALVAVLVLALVGGGALAWRLVRGQPPVQDVPTDVAVPVRSWPSGVWTGGDWSAARVEAFGAWRGSPADTAVMYPAYGTWKEIAESDWHVAVFDGFEGKLVYGLPLLPKESAGRGLDKVAQGEKDDVFEAVADTLIQHGRADSFVRVGLEAQGEWFPWGTDNGENTPEQFKAAFVHVAQLLRARMPQIQIVFDTSCGSPMRGQQDRMDILTELYPGDDVVDVIGCDNYDHYTLISHTEKQFTSALRPAKAAGLQDTLDFARDHGKKFAVPEWGLTAKDREGGGDNDYFIYAMYRWFAANADDIAFENYFNEPDGYLGSAIWDVVQNPEAAKEYRRLWGLTGSSSPGSSPSP